MVSLTDLANTKFCMGVRNNTKCQIREILRKILSEQFRLIRSAGSMILVLSINTANYNSEGRYDGIDAIPIAN